MVTTTDKIQHRKILVPRGNRFVVVGHDRKKPVIPVNLSLVPVFLVKGEVVALNSDELILRWNLRSVRRPKDHFCKQYKLLSSFK